MSVMKEVSQMILEIQSGAKPIKEIGIPADKWKHLYYEVEPIYKELYGGMLSASWCEVPNILYNGVAVFIKEAHSNGR